MKKLLLLFAALIGLVMVSCTKEDDIQATSGKTFRVETLTKYSHKFPHRGNVHLEITGEQYTFSGNSDQAGGVISTNYGEIPIKFQKMAGLKVRTRMVSDNLGGFNYFFLDGGYIILAFYCDDDFVGQDSIRYDIIAPDEEIEAGLK